MDRLIRRTGPAMLALLTLALTTGVVVAGEEEGEPVVLELTLSGDVDPEDAFSLFHQCETRNECVFVHDHTPVCSNDEQTNADYALERCEARTYQVTHERAGGDTIEYAIAFWNGGYEVDRMPAYLLRDSITVPEGGITLRLGYDYSREAQPAAPTTPPALPDTAAPPARDSAVIGVLLIAMSLLFSHLWTAARMGRT